MPSYGEHLRGELISAAMAYLNMSYPHVSNLPGSLFNSLKGVVRREHWPSDWGTAAFEPSIDPIRNLTLARGMIDAEMDRLQRMLAKSNTDKIEMRDEIGVEPHQIVSVASSTEDGSNTHLG